MVKTTNQVNYPDHTHGIFKGACSFLNSEGDASGAPGTGFHGKRLEHRTKLWATDGKHIGNYLGKL